MPFSPHTPHAVLSSYLEGPGNGWNSWEERSGSQGCCLCVFLSPWADAGVMMACVVQIFFSHLMAFFFSDKREYMLLLLVHMLCAWKHDPSLLLHFWRNPMLVFNSQKSTRDTNIFSLIKTDDLMTSVLFWPEFAGAGGELCWKEGSLT